VAFPLLFESVQVLGRGTVDQRLECVVRLEAGELARVAGDGLALRDLDVIDVQRWYLIERRGLANFEKGVRGETRQARPCRRRWSSTAAAP